MIVYSLIQLKTDCSKMIGPFGVRTLISNPLRQEWCFSGFSQETLQLVGVFSDIEPGIQN